MSNPKLTVLLPVYNPKRDWFYTAVDSILNQTFGDFHLLIIDDGSEDNSSEIILNVKTKDPRIKVVKNLKNIGLVNTLNKGLKITTSEYVARMDADDWSFPNRFELQIKFLEENPDIAVLGTYAQSMSTEKPIFDQTIISHSDILSTLPFNNCISHPSVIFRRNEILSIGGYPNAFGAEDYALWSKICFDSNLKIQILPEVCLKYRVCDGQKKYGNKQDESSKSIRAAIFRSIISSERNKFILNDDKLIWTDQKLNQLINAIKQKYIINNELLYKNALKIKKEILKNKLYNREISFLEYTVRKTIIKINAITSRTRDQ